MLSHLVLIANTPYSLILMNQAEVPSVAQIYFRNPDSQTEFISNFSTNPPKLKGTCYPHRRLIVCTLTGEVQSIVDNILHEIAHAWLFELGLDWQNETLTETLAIGFKTIRDMYFSDLLSHKPD
jgi:hypothetical protein